MSAEETKMNARPLIQDRTATGATTQKRAAIAKIVTALVLGYLSAIAWTIYADVVYHNQVPLEAFQFHGLYPISLGASAIITALLFDRNTRDIGFRRSALKYYLYAIGLAVAMTIVPFLANLLLGLIPLNSEPQMDYGLLAIGIPVLIILGLGEEVMWRGILYTNMSRLFNFWWTSIIIGLLWALWHYPVIIHTRFVYADRPLWYALMMLTTMTLVMSFVYNHLRAISGSVWPCAVLHAFLNYIAFVFIEPLESSVGANDFLFKSDIGITYILTFALVTFLAVRLYRQGDRPASQ